MKQNTYIYNRALFFNQVHENASTSSLTLSGLDFVLLKHTVKEFGKSFYPTVLSWPGWAKSKPNTLKGAQYTRTHVTQRHTETHTHVSQQPNVHSQSMPDVKLIREEWRKTLLSALCAELWCYIHTDSIVAVSAQMTYSFCMPPLLEPPPYHGKAVCLP